MLIDQFHRYENLRRDLEIRETTKKEINLGIEFLERNRSEKNIYIRQLGTTMMYPDDIEELFFNSNGDAWVGASTFRRTNDLQRRDNNIGGNRFCFRLRGASAISGARIRTIDR